MAVKRFWIARLSAMGDVVCSLPAACALKDAYPDSHITWVVNPAFAGLVKRCHAVDEVIAWKPTLNPSDWPTGEADVAFDLQGLAKSACAIAGVKAPVKLGYHWRREGAWLFSSRVAPDPTSAHIVDQYVDVVRATPEYGEVPPRKPFQRQVRSATYPVAEAHVARFGLFPTEEDLASVRAKLPMDGPFVAINPGAGWVTKRYPPASIAAVIDALPIPSVLIGGKSDEDHAIADEVGALTQRKPSKMTGETSIPELLALLSMAKAHLGGDTGSTHLSAALGIPAVGLYSLTRPERSCPYGQIERCLRDERGLAYIPSAAVISKLEEAIS